VRDILQDYKLFCNKEDNTVYRFSPLFFFRNVRILSASVANGVRFKNGIMSAFHAAVACFRTAHCPFFMLLYACLENVENNSQYQLDEVCKCIYGSCLTLESRA